MNDPLDREIRSLREVAGTPRDPLRRGMVIVADLLRRKGEHDLANEVLQEVRPELTEFAPLHLVEGRLLRDRARPEAARVSYGRALALDPENAEALEALATLAAAAGDIGEARRHRQAFENLPPWLGTPPRPAPREPSGEPDDPVDPGSFAPDPFADLEPLGSEPVDAPSLPVDPSFDPLDLSELGPVPDFVDQVAAPEGLPPEVEVEESEDDEAEFAVYTETLGELYARQKSYARAAEVFDRLLDADPANEAFQRRRDELSALARGPSPAPAEPSADEEGEDEHEELAREMSARPTQSHATVETPFAWDADGRARDGAEEAPTGSSESIGSYLERLLAWAPTPQGAATEAVDDRTPGLEVPASASSGERTGDLETDDRVIVPIESLAPDGWR